MPTCWLVRPCVSTSNSGEGSRRAAEWILGLMSHVPATHHLGLEVKQAKLLDTLSTPASRAARNTEPAAPSVAAPGCQALTAGPSRRLAGGANGPSGDAGPKLAEIRQSELDRTDLELIQIVLREPETVTWLRRGSAVRASRMHRFGKFSRRATTFKMKEKFRAMKISWFVWMIRRSARWQPA